MLHQYYRDELHYLHELARDFARAYPDDAAFLADPGSDPDVERLLEGVAFLTARLRLRLDDQLPELSEALVETLWPQLLRPVPSFTVLRFEALAQARQQLTTIPRGTAIDARTAEQGHCRFTTTWELPVLPLRIASCELRRDGGAQLRLGLERLGPGLEGDWRNLRLHLHGDELGSSGLRLALTRHLRAVHVETAAGRVASFGPEILDEVGFADDQALLGEADSCYAPFRLLQEWFCFGAKFAFVDLAIGQALRDAGGDCTVVCLFDQLPTGLPAIADDAVQLNCVPAVNLFTHPATPVTYDGSKLQLPLRALQERPADTVQLWQVEQVTGTVSGGGTVVLQPAAERLAGSSDGPFYQVLRRPAVVGKGQDLLLALDLADEQLDRRLQLSIEARCSNGAVAAALPVGSIRVPGPGCPPTVACSNLTRPTPERLLPLGGALHGRYAAALDLHRRGLGSAERFRVLLDCCDLPALVDRREEQRHRRLREAIVSFACRPQELAFAGGTVQANVCSMICDEDAFAGEGGLHLFASIVDRLLALAVTINSANQLSVEGRRTGLHWTFPPRAGDAALI